MHSATATAKITFWALSPADRRTDKNNKDGYSSRFRRDDRGAPLPADRQGTAVRGVDAAPAPEGAAGAAADPMDRARRGTPSPGGRLVRRARTDVLRRQLQLSRGTAVGDGCQPGLPQSDGRPLHRRPQLRHASLVARDLPPPRRRTVRHPRPQREKILPRQTLRKIITC